MLQPLLEKQGWKIVDVENERDALGILEKSPPDLIVLDLMMPLINGCLVSHRSARDRNQARSLPIAIVTAMNLTEAKQRRLADSTLEILQKRARYQELLLQEFAI